MNKIVNMIKNKCEMLTKRMGCSKSEPDMIDPKVLCFINDARKILQDNIGGEQK